MKLSMLTLISDVNIDADLIRTTLSCFSIVNASRLDRASNSPIHVDVVDLSSGLLLLARATEVENAMQLSTIEV